MVGLPWDSSKSRLSVRKSGIVVAKVIVEAREQGTEVARGWFGGVARWVCPARESI